MTEEVATHLVCFFLPQRGEARAKKERDDHIVEVDEWNTFMDKLNHRYLALAPWCDTAKCEIDVKAKSKEESLAYLEAHGEEEDILTGAAKTLCIPFEQKPLKEGQKCFACGADAKVTALWGRSY